MERAAWLAWHFLIPYQKKGSRLQPRDLLPDPPKKEAKERREVSPADRARAIEDLKREMGVED